MSLETALSERICYCENSGRQSLSPMIIERHSFCNAVCYCEWLWERERMEAA